jgi:hypothetical protein
MLVAEKLALFCAVAAPNPRRNPRPFSIDIAETCNVERLAV